ncbi:twisted gastrulation protein homolog 1-A-like [Latimeria chalumnae]|uniref:Twisted gastrulation BMP signaling modulator 1 n=1 Tax=Latimeria chalumnae TaxID=7897 RepID=M3XKL6_LATCH|nr:PREDICTED: twisted gastrulation protein homolog 1-A-like [Latimeria chalumnae]|eukprot:XP_006012404.1 PREDICTED: twisted gastrulation protein homolog 1-A-like [Latimeria chalumnae]
MYRPVTFLLLASSCGLISAVIGCNKALCASDVSKCLLQELCQCQVNEAGCPCCRECMLCLATLWDQCCDCVGLCNKKSSEDSHPTSRSSVEDLLVPIPSLFRALTTISDNDPPMGWSVVSIPVTEELRHQHHRHHIMLGSHKVAELLPGSSENSTAVCTVLYFHSCMSMNRCKQSCESLGASRYRWFHNACCECVGPDCHAYGSKEAACQNCNI